MQTKTDYLDTTLAKEKKSMAAMKASFAGPSGILPALKPPSWSLCVHQRVSFNAIDAEKLKSKGNSYAVSCEKDWPGSASNNQAIR